MPNNIQIIIAVVGALGLILFLFLGENKQIKNESVTGVSTSTLIYSDGAIGFYAEPKREGNFPGVVLVHEWWGLNEHIKKTAEDLADEGYRVLAVDLYGDVAETPERARELRTGIDQVRAVENMKDAVTLLRTRGATKVASWGWCFGGQQSLQLALSGESLDATIIYYGQLETDAEKLKTIQWPVLGVFGDKDTSIPVSQVEGFREGLNKNNIENEIYIYPGVGHAFANPSNQNHAPNETLDAWAKSLSFLERTLK